MEQPDIAALPRSMRLKPAAETLREHFRDHASTALLSARAEIIPGKSVVLGRALPGGGNSGIFLLIKPRRRSLKSIQELRQFVRESPDLCRDYLQQHKERFVTALAQSIQAPRDSDPGGY